MMVTSTWIDITWGVNLSITYMDTNDSYSYDALIKYLNKLEKWLYERWCWKFTEYKFPLKNIVLAVRLIHKKILFSMSGWLAPEGYAKRTGK